MTQANNNDLTNRVEQLKNDRIDLKLAMSALIEAVSLHQRNFETMQRNFELVVSDIRELQGEVRGLQTENRRLTDRLLGQQDEEQE